MEPLSEDEYKKIYDSLSIKQQRFVDYFDGNGTEAARLAGYKSPKQAGHDNMTKTYLKRLLDFREEQKRQPTIASREERQEFWSSVLRGVDTQPVISGYSQSGEAVVIDVPPKMTDRLKASELLGKSQADFTDKLGLVDKDGEDLGIDVNLNFVETAVEKKSDAKTG